MLDYFVYLVIQPHQMRPALLKPVLFGLVFYFEYFFRNYPIYVGCLSLLGNLAIILDVN